MILWISKKKFNIFFLSQISTNWTLFFHHSLNIPPLNGSHNQILSLENSISNLVEVLVRVREETIEESGNYKGMTSSNLNSFNYGSLYCMLITNKFDAIKVKFWFFLPLCMSQFPSIHTFTFEFSWLGSGFLLTFCFSLAFLKLKHPTLIKDCTLFFKAKQFSVECPAPPAC